MKLKVIKTVEQQITDFHQVCQTEDGKLINVDMLVSGDFPPNTRGEDLIGKTFEVERLDPFLSLAMNVNPTPL